jgi:hypothetical protein
MNRDEAAFDEILNRAEVKDMLDRAEREMFPMMKASGLSLVIAAEDPDAKLALEIGAAVLFDKPIVILVPKGRIVPPGLRRIARTVVEIDDFQSSEARRQIMKAIRDVRDADPS